MGIFITLALVLAPIIAGFMAEITLHFTTKIPALEAAPPPPPPVVHQTIINHYYGHGGPNPMDTYEPRTITTITESPEILAGGISKKGYLEAIHISQMIEVQLNKTEDQKEREKLESTLNHLLTDPDKDTTLEKVLGKKLTLADLKDYSEEEGKMASSLQAPMEGPMSEAARVRRGLRRSKAIAIRDHHHPMTKEAMKGLCSRLKDMEYDGATYKAKTLDVMLQKLGWVRVCMGFQQGGPAWNIIKIHYDVTLDRLIRSVVMNAIGLSIMAFGTRAYNHQLVPAYRVLADLDKDHPRSGILTLAMSPSLHDETVAAIRSEETRISETNGDGLMFEFVPPNG